MEKNDVLLKNEINANKVMVITLIAVAVVFIGVWILMGLDIFQVHGSRRFDHIYGTVLIEVLLGVVIGIHFRYDRPWLKYLLMALIISALAALDIVFTHNVPILIVLPIILSSRYFSHKYTLVVSALTLLVFLFSDIFGACFGDIDLNNMELPSGTVISLGNYTWLSDVFEDGQVAFDRGVLLKNQLKYSYTIELLQTVIVATAGVLIAYQGRRMIYEQKNMSEREARVNADLDLAAKIQLSMLPAISAVSGRDEFKIAASMNTAREVGGDFYDFFYIDDDHLCLTVADVSGKGIPAAMFMMSSKSILESKALAGKSPVEIISETNNTICMNNKERMFVTIWLGILEISTGKIRAVNAGHEYPALMTAGGSFEILMDSHGFVVGGKKNMKYTEYELTLQPGSKLFIYTDGVPEANDKDQNMFGCDRMTDALNLAKDRDPDGVLSQVKRSVNEFVSGAEQFDDLTMLCLEYKGASSE